MTPRCLPRILLAAALLLPAAQAGAEVAIPPLKARVTDLTNTLSAGQRASLEQKLAAFEARKGSQIGVLIVPTTQPEAVEQYAVRVQEAWKLGRKGVDDGVLMVVAKDDRRLWIEVGYGLEGALPDAIAKRIIDEEIVPRFKQGDFNGGISAGVDRIMRVIDGEPLPPPRGVGAAARDGLPLEHYLVIGLALVFLVGSFLRALFGRFLGSGIVGFASGLIAWVVVGSLATGIAFGIIALVLSLFGGARYRGWGGYPGGWTSGGGWSSGGGGWSGGWSGGGGMSGGGGAGGRW